ncbi:hypothetical protein [Actinoplanes utahensis]|uniref:Uncharacterized protein n=1 Tax=Actinoplanes utahensis TaxID=1869 RepID=A0A0A6UX26_ACTUT|nr:hypothetical protein [Actinoplanes utahensis]KHD78974.1 hypothetical protein MB27_02530 [Actinoplanes utahensis]GIF28041.1 hypothetical protein Aut01nite_10270 [Actinoplanes utahensis]
MEKAERRPIPLTASLAGLRLMGAGAVLGLALAVPASPVQADPPRPPAAAQDTAADDGPET